MKMTLYFMLVQILREAWDDEEFMLKDIGKKVFLKKQMLKGSERK